MIGFCSLRNKVYLKSVPTRNSGNRRKSCVSFVFFVSNSSISLGKNYITRLLLDLQRLIYSQGLFAQLFCALRRDVFKGCTTFKSCGTVNAGIINWMLVTISSPPRASHQLRRYPQVLGRYLDASHYWLSILQSFYTFASSSKIFLLTSMSWNHSNQRKYLPRPHLGNPSQ